MSLNFPLWEKDTSARPIVRGCRGKQHAATGHAPPPPSPRCLVCPCSRGRCSRAALEGRSRRVSGLGEKPGVGLLSVADHFRVMGT